MAASSLFDGRRNRRWGFGLRIAGHRGVYYSGHTIPADATPDTWGVGGPDWVPYRAITKIGTFTESHPQLGGVATQSPIDVTLAADFFRGDHTPGVSFSRLGVKASSWWGQVRAFDLGATVTPTLSATDSEPFDIWLDREPPAIAEPTVIHLGQEAMLATGSGGSEVGGGDPFYITIGERGVGDTIRRIHEVRELVRDYPVITTPEVVFWRSRRAVLLGWQLRENGTAGAAVEVMRGFIERTPEIGKDGLSAGVQVVPLLALLSQEAALPVTRTTLVRGLHLFELDRSDRFTVAARIPEWRTGIAAEASIGDGEIELSVDDLARWEGTFDPGAPEGSPRAGALLLREGRSEVPVRVTGTAGGPPRLILADAAAPYVIMPVLGGLQYVHADVSRIDVWEGPVLIDGEAEALLRWPGVVEDADFSALGRAMATSLGTSVSHVGADGTWARLSFGASSLTWYSTIWPVGGDIECLIRENDFDGRTIGNAAIDLPGAVEDVSLPGSLIRWRVYPIPRDSEGEATFDGVRYALAWRAVPERWILVNDRIDITGGKLHLAGQLVDVNPAIREIEVGAIGSDLDGETVYAIELLDPGSVPPVSEWEPSDRVEIRSAAPAFPSSGALLQYLLTDPAHLALGEDDIDLDSVLADGADPAWVTSWGIPESDEPLTYKDVIDPILKASRSALFMATGPDGRCRVTRGPVGVERPDRIAVTIGAGDWVAGSVPSWGTDDRLINRLNVRGVWADVSDDQDRSDYDWTYDSQHESRTSQRLFEEVVGDDIDLYAALELTATDDAVQRFAAQVLRQYEQPRRKWTGQVGTHLGVRCHLGATVRVTSRHLRGYDGNAVVEALGVVTGRTLDIWGEGVTLTMTHSGETSAGWNAAMRVATVPDDVTVTVEANAFSSPSYPTEDGSAWDDLTAFAVGGIVRCLPVLDQDAGANKTIADIDRADLKVTFTAPHGLAIGDLITPPAYGSATAFLKVYGYLADAGGTLGVAEDAGQRYA